MGTKLLVCCATCKPKYPTCLILKCIKDRWDKTDPNKFYCSEYKFNKKAVIKDGYYNQ